MIKERINKFTILLVIIFTAFCVQAQDRPAGGVTILPFQEDAADNTDEKLAMQFYQTRDFDKAAQIYEKLYEKAPLQSTYTLYLYCLLEIRDYKRAEKLIKSQSRTEQVSLRYMVDMGYLYYRQGEEEKSKKQYEEALKKLTPNQQQIFDLANAFIIRDENEYAIATYKKGRTLMNNAYPFSFELASIYERTGDFKSMLEEYVTLIESNKSYLQTVQDRLQYTLAYDPNNSKNDLFRKYILEKAQKEPEKPWYSELLWWYSVQQKDFSMALLQAKALDRRMKEDGNRVFQLATLSLSNDDYETAIDAYSYIVSKGPGFPYFRKARTALINTRYEKIVSSPDPLAPELIEIEKEFKKEFDLNPGKGEMIDLYINYAHLQAFWLAKPQEATEILSKLIDNSSIDQKAKAQCKLELADIMLFSDDVWEATLLYQQVYQDFKNDQMGEEAKFRNARLSYYIGEFKWAQTQLDILKAATSRLIANDAMALALLIGENYDEDSSFVALTLYSHADLLNYRNRYDMALKTLDSIFTAFSYHSIFDEALLKKATIKIKQGKYSEADTLLGSITALYPDDIRADEALFLRARINETNLKRNDLAMGFYSDLMSRYPGSVFVVDARKKYRLLRGDVIE